jgi:hypothetical protein
MLHYNACLGPPMSGRVELVARAICDAAGKTMNRAACVMCAGGRCTMWKTFRDEARAALRVMKMPVDDAEAAMAALEEYERDGGKTLSEMKAELEEEERLARQDHLH